VFISKTDIVTLVTHVTGNALHLDVVK